jgi:hypothetical protein
MLARYGRYATSRYLRQFRWWLFLNEGLSRVIKRRYLRLRRRLAGPRTKQRTRPARAEARRGQVVDCGMQNAE